MNRKTVPAHAGEIVPPNYPRIALAFLALLAAVFVALGAAGTYHAWADDATGEVEGKVTLQIVYGLDFSGSPDVVVNKQYDYYKDATVEDLLNAAVAAGDIKAFALNSYGYVQSITKADGTEMAGAADGSLYWSYYQNGGYYAGTEDHKTEKLKNATVYQFAWSSYPTAVSPNWSALPAPEKGAAAANQCDAELPPTAGTATLQIITELDGNKVSSAVVNKSFGYYADATLEDLLKAAVAEGDIKAYKLNSYNYIDTVTLADGTEVKGAADWSTYWSNFVNDAYYEGSDTVKTMKLASGTNYRIVLLPASLGYPVTLDWTALAEPANAAERAGTMPEIQGDCDPTAPAAGNATLQIVYGLDFGGNPQVLLNKTYDFYEGAVWEDLLKAAVAAGDIAGYTLDANGYPESVTATYNGNQVSAKNASDLKTYWSSYVDGGYLQGTDTVATMKVENGKKYQFAWNSYPTANAPATWPAAGENGSQIAGDPASKPADTPADAPVAPTVDKDKICALYNNIKAALSSGDETYWSTVPEWSAMDLAATGAASAANADAVVAAAAAAFEQPDGTNLQRSIIALSALGRDATAVQSGDQTLNLVQKMFDNGQSFNSIYGKAFALLALKSGSYSVPEGASVSVNDLIGQIIAAQNTEGGYAFSGTTSDADTTAMAIVALAAYPENADAAASVQKALVALKGMQLENGGFGTFAMGDGSTANANSTAMAVIAMAACGLDPATEWASASGVTPLAALLTFANSENNGFSYDGSQGNVYSNEQGFRALAAYYGYKDSGAAFNVYTQAKEGKECADCSNAQPVPTPEPVPNTVPEPADETVKPEQALYKNTIVSRDDPFYFDISVKVPNGANTMEITDKIDDRLSIESVEVTVDGAVIEPKVTVDGQNVKVNVDDAAQYRGKTLNVRINVKVKSDAVLSDPSGIVSIPNTGYVSVNGGTPVATDTKSMKVRASSATGTTTRTSGSTTSSTTAKTSDQAPITSLVVLMLVSGAAAAVSGSRVGLRRK